MIEYALLIMLGFCAGGLIAFLLAPTVWHRAVRLTTKRLEATLPMSLSDIEADKDLLKASYAIRIRRLEAGLNKARDKSANQLVEISRLQMTIGELQDQMAELEMQLEERKNAANVFESTIRKRFPELEGAVAAAKTALDERAFEINDLSNKLRRRDEALSLTTRAANLQQDEIRRLRETLEKSGSDITGRFKRRPSQWTLDEYRSEYDRLNVELSKMREQVILGHEREANQIAVLKTELQQLGEQIMSSVAAQDRESSRVRAPEAESRPWPGGRPQQSAAVPPKRGLAARPTAKAQPWPGGRPAAPKAPPPEPVAARPVAPAPKVNAPAPAPARDLTEPALSSKAGPSPDPASQSLDRGAVHRDDADKTDKKETREALQSLLDRGAKIAEDSPAKTGRGVSSLTAAIDATAARAVATAESQAGDSPATPAPELSAKPDGAPDPRLDQMFREIFETRAAASAAAAAGNPAAMPTPASPAEPGEPADGLSAPQAEAAVHAGSGADADKKRTLLDRLRVMHERQTG